MGAFDARTGEYVPPLNSELDGEFKHLLMYASDLYGGAKKGPRAKMIQTYLRRLKAAELDEQFVVTYAMAHGLSRTAAKHLRSHYQAA